jgi:hypothetical protein
MKDEGDYSDLLGEEKYWIEAERFCGEEPVVYVDEEDRDVKEGLVLSYESEMKEVGLLRVASLMPPGMAMHKKA